jgi:hypothetical protein
LLAQIFNSSRFFYLARDGRAVVGGDIKLFDNNKDLMLAVKLALFQEIYEK